jgi:hypothetical protein
MTLNEAQSKVGEEEPMAQYTQEKHEEGWEFKFLQSATAAFIKPEGYVRSFAACLKDLRFHDAFSIQLAFPWQPAGSDPVVE